MTELTRQALRRKLRRRLVRSGVLVAALVAVALGLGASGYHEFGQLPWLDAWLNAAMILTGMGPVNPMPTTASKLFAIAYALFSGVFFLTMVAVLLAPALQHFLHRFHLELSQQQAGDGKDQSIARTTTVRSSSHPSTGAAANRPSDN